MRNHLLWLALALLSTVIYTGCTSQHAHDDDDKSPTIRRDPDEPVTQFGPGGKSVLPTQQIITPAGRQVELPGMRPQAIAISPDGSMLVTSGITHDLVVIDPQNGKVVDRVPIPPDKIHVTETSENQPHNLTPDKNAQLSYTGLIFSPDGKRIYLSSVAGGVKVFTVNDKHEVNPLGTLPLPMTGLSYRKKEIPAGLRMSDDGSKLYVTLNVSNRLLEMDARSGKQLRLFDVGNAPFDVILAAGKAYVSNWGGRRPESSDVTGPIGQQSRVKVDPVRFIANEGSVSVIGLDGGKVLKEIIVGLHASALAATPDGKHVVVANSNSDSISVIDTSKDAVIQTLSTRWKSDDPFGCSPDALAFDSTGKTLYVCNGAQNSVAVVAFGPGNARLTGLIPAGWYPGAIAFDAKRNAVEVANIKGVGSGAIPKPGAKPKLTSHQYFGTVSLIQAPTAAELKTQTAVVLDNCHRRDALAAMLPARPNQPARPVPQRVGEPSVFKHIVYIIKENRTYDQVLGDMPEGRGEPSLCIFGEDITPNQHKISREFTLLDNAYCVGINSAEGHQWATSGIATDYIERSYAGFPRSYPDGMEDNDVDALAYAPTGFLWDLALAHGKSLRDFGEFSIADCGFADKSLTDKPRFREYYMDYLTNGGKTRIASRPAIESLRNYLATQTVGWDLNIPDILRADRFIAELHTYERAGKMPDLCIICLPNDHTSGTKPNSATPSAQVADNDLAMGKIVEAISRGPFWKDTCVLAIEDDPQAGFDHISAFRTTAYVASAYSKRHAVIHTNYNQPGLLRTIELILGLPPMNEMDALATPLTDCFQDKPDLASFFAVPSRVNLGDVNPVPEALSDPLMKHYADVSQTLPLVEPDKCPEDLLNRILWAAQRGSAVPYPMKYAGKVDDDD